MKETANHENIHCAARTASSIHVLEASGEVWANHGIFSQNLITKASAVLAVAGIITGILSILYSRKIISVEEKDVLVGVYYVLMFGSALRIAGKLDKKHSLMLIGNTILFQTWNTVFYHKPVLAGFIIVLGLWLPIYWMWSDPGMMKDMGFAKKNMHIHLLTGLLLAVTIAGYFAWGVSNYGFKFRLEPWRVFFNTVQVFPMYITIFGFFHIVWNRLKTLGLSPISILLALGIMSAALNAPVFLLVGIATSTPPAQSFGGFAAITCIMALTTHLTFRKFRSALPSACLFTAMSNLLLIYGLI